MLKTYRLFQSFQKPIQRFPKPWRYSLGEKIQSTLLEIIKHTGRALYARQPLKEPVLLELIGLMMCLQLFIRLAGDEKLIPDHLYFSGSAQIQELQRMTVGWLKSVRSP